MNQKILILVVGLLAGAGVVYLVTKDKTAPSVEQAASVPDASTSIANAETKPAPAPIRNDDASFRPRAQKPTVAPASAWSKLAEKYGTEKTALSSKITSNLTSVITQGLELANAAARNGGSSNLTEAATKDLLKRATSELGLTEEQQKKAGAVIQTAVDKRMTAVSDLTAAMGSEPEQMMELFLAGDALARKEISQEEYDRLTLQTRTMLQNMTGFVGGRGMGAGQLLADEETTSQINAILTPEQQAKLAEITAKMAADIQARANSQNQNGLFQPGQIPVMELDQLDQSIAAVQQMTSAAKQMMEAMKGLKEANTRPR